MAHASTPARWAASLNGLLRVGLPPMHRRGVALTFDDGPDPDSTPALLDALRRNRLDAVFFLTGRRVAAHPDLAAAIAQAGHQIGSHGHSHQSLLLSGARVVETDLGASLDAIRAATGRQARLFRPPYGRINPLHLGLLRRHRLRLVLWNRMPGDYDPTVPFSDMVAYVQKAVRPGDVILLHDTPATAPVMPGLIDALAGILHDEGLMTTTFVESEARDTL